MKKFFANGKEFTKEVKAKDKEWLAEMSSIPAQEGITELDVGDMSNYSTLTEKVAIMTLKETVNPAEPATLKIDEKRHSIFKIKRQIAQYSVTETYCTTNMNKHFGPCSVKKIRDDQTIDIKYYQPNFVENVICTISWTDYAESLDIEISEDVLDIVLKKRDQFELYLESISPEKINHLTIFKQLSKLLGGTKMISVFVNTDSSSEKEIGIKGACRGREKIEYVRNVYKYHTVEYEYGKITYESADGMVTFENPEKTFDEYKVTLTDKQIIMNIEPFVKKATTKSKAFYEKICEI